MAFPLPPAFRKKMVSAAAGSAPGGGASASDAVPNPLGVSESESDAPDKKGEKPNPLKAWADNKLAGR